MGGQLHHKRKSIKSLLRFWGWQKRSTVHALPVLFMK